MNMLWPDSLLPLATGGTHPAADAAPLRSAFPRPWRDRARGSFLALASWDRGHPGRVAGWKPALLEPHPSEDPRNNMHHTSRRGGRRPGWVPPLLLAVVVASAGCAVVPLSLHQTLPPTRMALASLEGAQRSLDDAGMDYEESLETAPAERPVAAYGATHGAYQRWVTDEVRELPSVSQTIAIGGGDT